ILYLIKLMVGVSMLPFLSGPLSPHLGRGGLLVSFASAEQSLAEAMLDRRALAHRQHERRVRRRHLDGAEYRAGLAVEPGHPRLKLCRGMNRPRGAETRRPRHGGQVDAVAGMGGLHPGLAVVLVVDHDDGQIA